MMNENVEVLVVGAGPAGSALAYLLAQAGRDVLLIDKAAFPRDKTCGDGLTPRALGALKHLNLLEQITATGRRIDGLHFYAPNGRRVASPIPAFGDLPRYLVVLPRMRLDHLILQHALSGGARYREKVEATNVLREGGRVVGITAQSASGPEEIRARYVVVATGAGVGLLERAQLLERPPQFGRAVRGYYEGVGQLTDAIEFHMHAVPLPGYAWIFPTSEAGANIGVGDFTGKEGQAGRPSPRQALDNFMVSPVVAKRMAGAKLQGNSLKGYPLRFDFPTARLAFPGLMLIGEAAGLVNPLTGEGIDYALESAEAAAAGLLEALRQDRTDEQAAETHTRALRARFQRTFLTIVRVRDFYLRAWLLNRATSVANRHDDFCRTLVNVCLGNVDPVRGLTPKMMVQLAMG
jgi:geranylgeranyl reductase family protein